MQNFLCVLCFVCLTVYMTTVLGADENFIFGSSALQALDLVDQRSVTCVSSPSGRKAFQVAGGSGRLYTCFLSCHYCPCPAFAYTVLRRNGGLLCKHLLAVYLCQAMAVTQQDSVSDQQMSALLSGTSAR
uniref:Zinc finger, SWIM-type containing 7 n=1 Tax=Salarias fasciatus TaxID=181472 RepID=A0A672GIT4_SALFA